MFIKHILFSCKFEIFCGFTTRLSVDDLEMIFSNLAVPFGIEAASGIVAVTMPLTKIPRTSYELETIVKTFSSTNPGLTLSTNVTIQVAPETHNGITRDATITLAIAVSFRTLLNDQLNVCWWCSYSYLMVLLNIK